MTDNAQEFEINTNDLIGPALDWAVAIAEGWGPDRPQDGQLKKRWLDVWLYVVAGSDAKCDPPNRYSPSTDWAQGGPLLDAHCKSFGCVQDGTDGNWRAFGYGNGKPFDPNRQMRLASGPSILIASCRAIVAAKLGDTVMVPQQLQQHFSSITTPAQ